MGRGAGSRVEKRDARSPEPPAEVAAPLMAQILGSVYTAYPGLWTITDPPLAGRRTFRGWAGAAGTAAVAVGEVVFRPWLPAIPP